LWPLPLLWLSPAEMNDVGSAATISRDAAATLLLHVSPLEEALTDKTQQHQHDRVSQKNIDSLEKGGGHLKVSVHAVKTYTNNLTTREGKKQTPCQDRLRNVCMCSKWESQ